MRIIGGKYKGRKFIPPAKNWPTRPTTDYAKEGLFNILTNKFDFSEIKMLDLFGGTGNHSYESISRGCTDVTYVDKFYGCIKFVNETARTLEIQDEIKIIKADVFKFMAICKDEYDYIFAGPPYPLPNLPQIPDLIFEHDLLKKNGVCVVEHSQINDFEAHPNFRQKRAYGGTIFSFFENEIE